MSSVRSCPGSTPLPKPAVPCAGRLPAGARCRRAAAPPARAAGAGLGLAHFDRHPGARPSPGRRQGGGPARPRGTAPLRPAADRAWCRRPPGPRPRSVSPRCPGQRDRWQSGPRARPAPASPCPAERSWYGPAWPGRAAAGPGPDRTLPRRAGRKGTGRAGAAPAAGPCPPPRPRGCSGGVCFTYLLVYLGFIILLSLSSSLFVRGWGGVGFRKTE